jgi:hypothetical protein
MEIKVALASKYSSTAYFDILLFIPKFDGLNIILSQNDQNVPIISIFFV